MSRYGKNADGKKWRSSLGCSINSRYKLDHRESTWPVLRAFRICRYKVLMPRNNPVGCSEISLRAIIMRCHVIEVDDFAMKKVLPVWATEKCEKYRQKTAKTTRTRPNVYFCWFDQTHFFARTDVFVETRQGWFRWCNAVISEIISL